MDFDLLDNLTNQELKELFNDIAIGNTDIIISDTGGYFCCYCTSGYRGYHCGYQPYGDYTYYKGVCRYQTGFEQGGLCGGWGYCCHHS